MSEKLSVVPGVSELVERVKSYLLPGRPVSTESVVLHNKDEDTSLYQLVKEETQWAATRLLTMEDFSYELLAALEASVTDNARLQESLARYISGECACPKRNNPNPNASHFPGCPVIAIERIAELQADKARLRAEVEELRKQVPQRIPKEEWLELPDGNYWVITPEDGEAVIAKKNIHGFYCMGNPLPFNTVQGVFRIAPKPTIDIQPSPVGADISIHEPVRAEEKR